MQEIWRDVIGYEGLYQVSNKGRVKCIQGKYNGHLMSVIKHTGDYFVVSLRKNKNRKQFKIHRLVAQAFIPNPDNLPQINHKDEDKANNSVENLEWCTAKYNVNYGTRGKRSGNKIKQRISTESEFAARWRNQARINGAKTTSKKVLCVELDKIFNTLREAGDFIEKNNYKHVLIGYCCRGTLTSSGKPYTTAYGYHWKFLE